MVTEHFRRIRAHWNRTDTVVMVSNTAALVVFVVNSWWRSALVCCAASIVPLLLQGIRARRVQDALWPALLFGAIIGAAWPVGEGIVTAVFGWWGEYLAPGPVVWRTPVYCMLIGWLASTHIYYVCQRSMEMGFGKLAAVANTVLGAAFIGVIGENLFVAARMWVYHPSPLDWASVPAFVPIAYGIGYGVLPLIRDWRAPSASAAVAACLLVVSVGLGLAVGFFPR